MAVAIDTLGAIKEYLEGVAERADDHAKDVQDIALTLAGAVLLRATGGIRARDYDGTIANMLWFMIDDQQYVLAYNHRTREIELRERSQQGSVLATFTNNTTAATVRRVFMGL